LSDRWLGNTPLSEHFPALFPTLLGQTLVFPSSLAPASRIT
jgi:hypothetical protein